MAKKTKEEMRKRHNQELSNIRVKRFYEKHKMKTFSARFEQEYYDEIVSFLKSFGITQKEFIIRSYEHLRDKGGF